MEPYYYHRKSVVRRCYCRNKVRVPKTLKRHLCAAEPARSASSGLHRDGARGEVLRDGAGAHLRQVRLPQRQGHPRTGLPELAFLH